MANAAGHRQTRTIAQSRCKRPGGRRAAFRAADGVAALAACVFQAGRCRAFCLNDDVYRADLSASGGEAGSLPATLARFRTREIFSPDVDADSLIVIRGEDGAIGAANVCRHRGSLICNERGRPLQEAGLPLSSMTYGLDGKLLACRGCPTIWTSPTWFEAGPCARIDGLIYLPLNDVPPDFEPRTGLFRRWFGHKDSPHRRWPKSWTTW